MNNGESKQEKSRKKVSVILLLLAIFALISMVVVAGVIGGLSRDKNRNYIPIADDTVSRTDSRSGEGEASEPQEEGKFKVEWDRRIFCVSYTNGKSQVTVLSDDGRKVIAPGTSWNYSYSLHNTMDFTLRYTMSLEAIVEGLDEEYTLPVLSRVKGPKGWISPGGKNYGPVLELNNVHDNGVLSPNTVANYRLSWKWPFESGNDEFDTMLGNMALEKDITLYINIHVYACEETKPDVHGGDPIPGTGDDFRIGIWLAAMIISLFAFIAVLANSRRREDAEA